MVWNSITLLEGVCVRNCEGFLAEYYLSISYHALQLNYLKPFAEQVFGSSRSSNCAKLIKNKGCCGEPLRTTSREVKQLVTT